MPFIQQSQLAGLIIQGAQGQQGSVGAQGAQGATGAQGLAGAQGVQGATGPQGVQGAVGAQGTVGAQGVQGATGPQGVQGAVGVQGAQGSTGAQGVQGATGPQGVQGATPAIGGSNTQIQFNNSGALGGSANLVWNNSSVFLGIGETSPTCRLSIKGNNVSARGQITIDSTDTAQYSFYNGATEYFSQYTDVSGSNSGTTYANYTAAPFAWRINGAETMRITSAGLVGIGTSSPGSILTVGNGTASEYIDVNINGGTSSNYGPTINLSKGGTSFGQIANYGRVQGGTSSDFFITSVGSNAVVFGINQTEKVRIDTSGNVGIGQTSPTVKLDILNTNATYSLSQRIFNASAGTFWIGQSPNATFLSVDNFDLAFCTNSNGGVAGSSVPTNERMRIDNAGNVGIGATSIPSFARLQVTGTAGLQTGASQQIQISAPTAVNNEGAGIRFNAASGGREAVGIIGLVNNTSGNAGSMTFHVYNGGGDIPEWMRITSAGKVGIGTTNPQTDLMIGNADGASRSITVHTENNGNARLRFREGSTVSSGYNEYSFGMVGADNALTWEMQGYGERMRLDGEGRLLIGTTSSIAASGGAYFQISATKVNWLSMIEDTGTAGNVYCQYLRFGGYSPNDATSMFLYCGDNVGQRMSVRANGGIYNYSANDSNLSDEREKKNIQLAPNYLDKICQIPVKTFLYNDQTDTDLNLGVIAQDVEAVCPELIIESNWANKDEEPRIRKSIYQTDLQYALMKCIQEQQALIESLTSRLTTLENQ